jgi:hypothetical protein
VAADTVAAGVVAGVARRGVVVSGSSAPGTFRFEVRSGVDGGKGVRGGSGVVGRTRLDGGDAGADAGAAADAEAVVETADEACGASAFPDSLDSRAVRSRPQAWQLVWPRKTRVAPQNLQTGTASGVTLSTLHLALDFQPSDSSSRRQDRPIGGPRNRRPV